MEMLDDPAFVLDLLTGFARPDDGTPGLYLVPADARGEALRIVIPVDVPARLAPGDRARLVEDLVRLAARVPDAGGLVLAVRRGGSPAPRGDDLAWHDAFDAVCSRRGFENLGVYVATPWGARQVEPGWPEPAGVFSGS